MTLGLPLPTREKEIAELLAQQSPRSHELKFQNKLQPFPIHRVRLELPKYRLENGRTSAAQQDWLSRNKQAEDFFDTSRCENDEVQAVQHEILVGMAKSSDADKDLFKVFAKRNQELPLILDQKGFVINGNRRLATWREIHDTDAARFTHVDVIILPPCDPRDIDELEVHLQVERDIKQEYSWISLAYAIRHKIDTQKYGEDQVAEIFQMTPKDVRQRLDKLALAEEYLASRNKSGQYLELEKTEFAFNELQKALRRVTATDGCQKLASEVAYRLIDKREGDRVYRTIPEAIDIIEPIKQKLLKELLADDAKSKLAELQKSVDDELFPQTQAADLEDLALAEALKSSNEDEKIEQIINDAIEAERERQREATRGNSALEAIRSANTKLLNAVNALATQTSTDGIEAQLNEIASSLSKIRNWLKERENA